MQYGFEEWHDLARVFFDVAPLDDPSDFRAQASFSLQGELILTDARFPPLLFDHDPARIRGVDHGYLLFERYLSGSGRGLIGDAATRIDAGSIHLLDMSRRYRTLTSGVVTRGVIIPHAAIGYDPSRHRSYARVSLASKPGRLVDFAHQSLAEAAARASPEAEPLARGFLALVRALVLGQWSHRSDAGNRALVKAYIDRHLSDPELTTERLCASFGLSRSVLYRLFEPDGGVIRYITDRRLDRCYLDLAAAPAERGEVRRVAETWGFYQPGNFHRGFRRRFGVAPSDCLQSRRIDRGDARKAHPVHQWMRNAHRQAAAAPRA